jgi:hypothetical protein
MTSAAREFRQALKSSNDFAQAIDEPGFPLSEFLLVQDWQRQRFQLTYADYLARESDRPACQFFLDELYGGLGFRERDEDVNRVEPIMSRLLPGKALRALSEALTLQLISLELDQAMAMELREKKLQGIDGAVYVEIYQRCGRRPEREYQIGLIRKLGLDLIVLTDMPLLLGLVKAVRKPALAAGFGRLQCFLEQGLSSFRQLQNPADFVEVIYQREWELMVQWFESGTDQPVIPVSC